MIACVMLTRDRTDMSLRAIRDFCQQSCSEPKSLYVCDNSETPDMTFRRGLRDLRDEWDANIQYEYVPFINTKKLCEMMNFANGRAVSLFKPEFLAKWDSDDRSNRDRLAHQLGIVKDTGVDVTGYNELPFRDEQTGEVFVYQNRCSTYAIGTSLFMRARAWRDYNFPMTPSGRGSDTAFVHHWAARAKMHGVSGMMNSYPMMVASFHAGNSSMTMATRYKGGFRKATARIQKQVEEFRA
jgi:hypothetical protein